MKIELLTYDELTAAHKEKAKSEIRKQIKEQYELMGIRSEPNNIHIVIAYELEKHLFIQLEGFSVYMFNQYKSKL